MSIRDLLALGAMDDDDDMGDDDDGMGFDPRAAMQAIRRAGVAMLNRRGGGRRGNRRALPSGIGSRVAQVQQLLATPAGGPGTTGGPQIYETVLGSQIVTFTAGGVTAAQMKFVPFARCRPSRIVANYTAVGVPGQLVTCTSAGIGRANMLGGPDPVDVNGAWPANVTYSNINWATIDPSVPLLLNLQLTGALAAATSIVQSITLYVAQSN